MLLPNGKLAIVDLRKLRDYCLNPDNPRGSAKARVFASALGITAKDSEMLRARLLEVAASEHAAVGELDLYGQRYTIDFEVETESGRAGLRSGWIVLRGEAAPRLTTCFVRRGGGNVQE
jgi:hypothetical protein